MIEYKLVKSDDGTRKRSRLSVAKPMESAVVYAEPTGFFDGEQGVFGRMWSREKNNKTPSNPNQLMNGVLEFFRFQMLKEAQDSQKSEPQRRGIIETYEKVFKVINEKMKFDEPDKTFL